MDDLEIRPMTAADAPAVVDLLAAAEAVDRVEEYLNLDDVVEMLENPMIDPGSDWLVALDGGEVVASEQLWPRAPADGEISVGIEGVVRPDHRDRGIASALLPRMVERAKAYVAERGDLRPVLRAHARTADDAAAGVLRAAGFVEERWSFVMVADLTGEPGERAEPPEVPEGYRLATWESATAAELMATHNRSFPGHPAWTPWDEEMWQQWVTGSRAHRPALSLLLRDASGAVAAYVHTQEFEAVQEQLGIREAFVSKVGTAPEHRRRGLADVLLRTALARFREEGFARAALDVDTENPTGALGLYERAGFAPHQRFTLYVAAS